MALTADDVAQIENMIAGAERAMAGGLLCTPVNPHDTMTYQRGPNIYHCRCGQTYEKDGHGGLREV